MDWFWWHINPYRVILCQEVRESHSLYVHIYIFFVFLFLKNLFFLSLCRQSSLIRIILNRFIFYFNLLIGSEHVLPLRVIVDQRVMAIMDYSQISQSSSSTPLFLEKAVLHLWRAYSHTTRREFRGISTGKFFFSKYAKYFINHAKKYKKRSLKMQKKIPPQKNN